MKDFREMENMVYTTNYNYYENGVKKQEETIEQGVTSVHNYNEKGEPISYESLLRNVEGEDKTFTKNEYIREYWDNGNLKSITEHDLLDKAISHVDTYYEDGRLKSHGINNKAIDNYRYDGNTTYCNTLHTEEETKKYDLDDNQYIELTTSNEDIDTTFKTKVNNADGTIDEYDIRPDYMIKKRYNSDGQVISSIGYSPDNMDLYKYDENGNVQLTENYMSENDIKLQYSIRNDNIYNENNQLIKTNAYWGGSDPSDIDNWYDCTGGENLYELYIGEPEE